MKPSTAERIYPSLGENYSKPGILLILRLILSSALLAAFRFSNLAENVRFIMLIAAALISGCDI
ncbi:MAG: hypothetical protein VB064_10675, partial [Oscillospiraceae bacterium]|nr:hypothetical protein [Oscillospiraceae bacterium]